LREYEEALSSDRLRGKMIEGVRRSPRFGQVKRKND